MITASPPPSVSKRVWSRLLKGIQRRKKTKRTGNQCRVTGKEQLDLEGLGPLGAGTTKTMTVCICYLHFMTKWNSFVTPNRKPWYQVHIFILKISRLVNTVRIGLGVSDRNHAVSVLATEQDTVGLSWAQNPCPVSPSLVCIRTLVF